MVHAIAEQIARVMFRCNEVNSINAISDVSKIRSIPAPGVSLGPGE
jgi:hypothetical protein